MKRGKLVVSLMMCVFCLSFLVVGVWAAASVVTLNINGDLKFYPEGLFVELSGEVYRGNSPVDSEMTKLTDPRFSYGPVANFDSDLDEISGNFPLEPWEIGNLAFIPAQRYIKIKVYITNYSDFSITSTPVVKVDNKDISTITIDGFNITSTTNDINIISTSTTGIYELTLEVTGDVELINSLNVNFEFEEYVAPYYYKYFNIENNIITGLTNVYVNEAPTTLIIPGYTEDGKNALSIGDSAFNFNISNSIKLVSSTTTIVMQDGLTSIGDGAFNFNVYIVEAIIPKSVTRIGKYSFGSCENFSSAIFEDPKGWQEELYGDIHPLTEDLSDPEVAAHVLTMDFGLIKS